MLNIKLEIFDDGETAEAQARGVVAALVAIYGPSVLPGTVSRYVLPRHDEPVWSAPAPDGYPVEADDLAVAPEGAKVAATLNAVSEATGLSASMLTGNGPVPSGMRDVAGIPWDERIHASTKTTNKDGTWTRRRNTPDEVFDKVMAELKAANTAMTLEAATSGGLIDKVGTLEMGIPEPTAAEAFTPPASVVIPPHVPAPPVPVAVPQPPAPPALMPTVVESQKSAEALDKSAEAVEIMKAVNAKQVPQDKLAEIMASAGLKGLGEVFTAPIETRRVVAAALAAL